MIVLLLCAPKRENLQDMNRESELLRRQSYIIREANHALPLSAVVGSDTVHKLTIVRHGEPWAIIS